MAKYSMTLLLLLCLALENDQIYNRLHARSHPGSREDEKGVGLQLMRQHQQYQHHQAAQQQTPPQQQHHTKQQRARLPKRSAPDPGAEEDAANQRQHYVARVRRHMREQQLHRLQQLRSYHRNPQPEQLKSMPRLWQHLSDVYDDGSDSLEPLQHSEELDYPLGSPRMYGDAPAAELVQDEAEDELDPLGFIKKEDELDPLGFIKKELLEHNHVEELPPFEPQPEPELVPEPAPVVAALYASSPLISVTNSSRSTGGCPKCESNRQVEHITEEELTRLRIEFVKQQILEKLRLKESPKVSAVELPKPIFEGVTLSHADEAAKNKELDDYYARTSKKFIFLKREYRECNRLGAVPSICFSFKIDDADAEGYDVSTAVLWLFKNKQNHTQLPSSSSNMTLLLRPQQTLVVSEVEQQLDTKYLPLAKTVAIQSVDDGDEWMKIDIEWPIKRWFGNHDLSHLIQIRCESCDISSMEELISVSKDYRPFIMIDTQNRRSKSRQKRSINCSDGVTECCREKLYISFADIGWDNWIVQPPGYDAYFCRGSCSSVASVTQAASHHSSLLKILSTNGTRKPLELIPCCTAKQYSSLQLVVLDSNNSATLKTLPNMVVESCGCR